MNLKDAAEYTVNKELSKDRALAALFPKRQAADGRVKLPHLVSMASPGREYAYASGIYQIPVAITLRYDAKDQAADYGAAIMERVRARLVDLQQRGAGACGVIFESEPPERKEGDMTRARTLNVTLVGQQNPL